MSVDFICVGIGHPLTEYSTTRFNAGYVFADYLANCVSMQTSLLSSGEKLQKEAIPADFKRPVFERMTALGADVLDVEFAITEADMHTGPKSTLKAGSEEIVKKRFRLLIVKCLTDPVDSGKAIASILNHYKVDHPEKKLIVVYGDCGVMEGSIGIQHGSITQGKEPFVSKTGVDKMKAVKSISAALGSNDYVRIRLGLGSPSGGQSDDSFLLETLKPSKEMDMFGFVLDIAGQHYAAFEDLKATKKKYASSKKVPSELRKLPGLVFPVQVVELTGEETKE